MTSDLKDKILSGNIRAAARLMRRLDDREPDAIAALGDLYPSTGRAYILGVTGNPGSGKSTLVNRLIAHYRRQDKRVGVVAVDPSSPFTGGAILGDRIRMMEHATDPGVFIRSLATRGHLGGLTRSTQDVVAVMDAMGMDVIIIETVGVGQDEIEVVKVAHTSVVVMVPGLGDMVQAIKAGILEIADVFAVNKADKDGVGRIVADLRGMLELIQATGHPEWLPKLIKTVATRDEGIDDLAGAIDEHRAFLEADGGQRMEAKLKERSFHLVVNVLKASFFDRLDETFIRTGRLDGLLDEMVHRERDPYDVSETILDELMPRPR